MRHTANTTRRRLEKQADALFQEAVILMFRGHCIGYSPECTGVATVAHHLIPRSDKMHRHMLMNGISCCAACHAEMHSDKKAFLNWLKQRWYSLYEWHMLNRHKHPERVSEDDLRTTVSGLKSFISLNK